MRKKLESDSDKTTYVQLKKIIKTAKTNLDDVEYYTASIKRELSNLKPLEVSIKNIQDELKALKNTEDFDSIKISSKKQTITATTSPIIINGVEFGRFEIKLTLTDRYIKKGYTPYSIRALDPNRHEDHIHPHMSSSDSLCEGEGGSLLKLALRQGRIEDYLMILKSILCTYGNDPYQSLGNWSRYGCKICGRSTSGYQCFACGKITCVSHYTQCSCGKKICTECGIKACKTCGIKKCADCLDEKQICKSHRQRKTQNGENNEA